MYVISLSNLKNQQFCARIRTKGCCRVQKIPPCSLPQGRKKRWWVPNVKDIFGKYLLVTNTLSSAVLMALGDLIQQEIEYLKEGKHTTSFDWRRNKNMGIVGTLQGPLIHTFYQILDKYFPGTKPSTIIKKIFLDQIIASPVLIVFFFGTINYLENETFEQSKSEIMEKFWLVYTVDCSLWIPAQFLNFYLVSSVYRVIYINLLTMCYNVFLSFAKHEHNSKDVNCLVVSADAVLDALQLNNTFYSVIQVSKLFIKINILNVM